MLAGAQHGISVAQIYRAANNPLMDRMIARFRGDRGEFIPKGAIAARRAIEAQRRFGEIDEAFPFDEGEGDRTLAYWRRAHRNYFGRQGTFAPDMPLYCERFRVIGLIDPQLIDLTGRT